MHGGRLSDSDGGVKHIGYSLGWNARRPFISQTVNRCLFNGSLDQAGGWCNPNDDSLERTTSGRFLQTYSSSLFHAHLYVLTLHAVFVDSSGTNGGFMGPGYLLSTGEAEGEQVYQYFGAWPHSHGDLMAPGQNNSAIVCVTAS